MNQSTKLDIRRELGLMRALSDEVRVKLIGARADAKDAWRRLEPRLAEVERDATDLSDATRAAVHEAVIRLDEMLNTLGS